MAKYIKKKEKLSDNDIAYLTTADNAAEHMAIEALLRAEGISTMSLRADASAVVGSMLTLKGIDIFVKAQEKETALELLKAQDIEEEI